MLPLIGCQGVRGERRRWRPQSPASLAAFLDPKFRVTPTIKLLSDVAVRSVTEPDQRDCVSTPPRTGKSELLAVWTPVWALMRDPDLQIVVVSHGDDLAREHSRKARQIIKEHAGFLGFELAVDKTAVGRWRVEGRRGGMLALGINSGIVGFGSDVMIVDDPVKAAADADSKLHRERIVREWSGSLATRVHPGGSVMVVSTRWHEDDLAGYLLKTEPEKWHQTNIPAVSQSEVPDALDRPPGKAMVSALGYSAEHFFGMRRTVGERMWFAQYMGVPSAPEGDLIKQQWLDDWRLDCAPLSPVKTVVSVDPADSGEGDEAGILACSLTSEGVVAVIADKSAQMTSDAWAKAAVELAVAVGASEIAVESFAARETYSRVVREAIKAKDPGRRIAVTAWPPKGSGRGGGDALARSSALLQALEVGTCRLAGHFGEFERQATTWQSGKHQPDRLAALVVGHDVLVHSVGREWQFASPLDFQRRRIG